jgi:hypothetical protein
MRAGAFADKKKDAAKIDRVKSRGTSGELTGACARNSPCRQPEKSDLNHLTWTRWLRGQTVTYTCGIGPGIVTDPFEILQCRIERMFFGASL